MKLLKFLKDNILFVVTLFLLAFIPLYPKIPIVDIQNTWVYIRLEDFAVLLALGIWVYLFIKKKVTLKTPLTIPILAFWVVGGIATLNGVLILFPKLSNVFANVGFLSYLRRIEYMSLFFVAYFGFKDKRFLPYVCITLTATLLLIIGYGFGQRFLGFPAFLTMNEEFAKGIPIQLSELSRIPSTFAGHYDLAAYLVLVIPIIVSLAFGIKKWFYKIFLLSTAALGFVLLFMTVSRVSVFVLVASLGLLLVMQKRKLVIASFIVLTFLLLILSPSLLNRFQSTVSEVEILVDAKTGQPIGQVKSVPKSYVEDKLVVYDLVDSKTATSSSVTIPYKDLPPQINVIVENLSTGESLPQGTSYINLSLSPVLRRSVNYFYERAEKENDPHAEQIQTYYGDYLVKRAKAYDLSFTTRFQGEWPHTILAFERNIFLGSGYGSVSLAVDNDYLRLLGETGLLGFLAFLSIFAVLVVYIRKIFPKIDSKLAKSFILGFAAGTFGLALNAILIDVFEASKIAFSYWLLMGITFGLLVQYKEGYIDVFKEIKKLATSKAAIISYLLIVSFTFFSSMASYYFVGDDFTWLRWAADCIGCNPAATIVNYFTQADGFFYRPGAKIYFDFMYQAFWLNQTAYHFVSIFLHFLAASLVFLISGKLLKNVGLSAGAAFLFLILSGYTEALFWISASGILFSSVFALASLLTFIIWMEKKSGIYLAFSILLSASSMLFHELGIVAPLLVITYDLVFSDRVTLKFIKEKAYYLIVLFPLLPYALLRYSSNSHWSGGDYSYSLLKLPFNFVGNALGYFMLSSFGPATLPVYEKLRDMLRSNLGIAIIGSLVVVFVFLTLYRFISKKFELSERKLIIFSAVFFIVSLLPFLGLGNIASRYSYLASFAFCLVFVILARKLYSYLLDSGKLVAGAIIVIVLIIFSSAHLFQLQKINGDWKNAGVRTQSVLTALGYVYAHYTIQETPEIFFVNVPIREGNAWVFPVGLTDAAWLVFRDKPVKIHQVGSVEEAFALPGDPARRVFEFDSDGKLIEYIKTLTGEITPEGQ
ncbi:MAG: hypothetical protein WD967_02365 [Candidatus Levyibacteriota bacterium]